MPFCSKGITQKSKSLLHEVANLSPKSNIFFTDISSEMELTILETELAILENGKFWTLQQLI